MYHRIREATRDGDQLLISGEGKTIEAGSQI